MELMNQRKVTVYTQKKSLIRDFLLALPGKHEVLVDTRYWDCDFGPEFTTVQRSENHKAIIKDVRTHKPDKLPRIGLDVDAEIVFTKNIINKPRNKHNVYVDHITFPFITKHKSLLFRSALLDKPVTIYCANNTQLNYFHDQLVMNGIEHNMYQGHEGINICHGVKYQEFNTAAVVYDLVPIQSLCALHEHKSISIVVNEKITYLKEEVFKKIHALMNQQQHYGINSYFLQRRLQLHHSSIAAYMSVLEVAGIVKTIEPRDKTIHISKKAIINNDPLFYAIPEGDHSIFELMEVLKVKRRELFQILKSYEGKLIFSYTPPKCLNYWYLNGDLKMDVINNVMAKIQSDCQLFDSLNLDCQNFVNSMVQSYCASVKTEAVFTSEGVKTDHRIISLVS